jgi:hypothetical protein
MSMIYDPVRDRLLLFGGYVRCGSACSTPQNDVWQLTLAGTPTWSQITPAGTPPPPRSGAGAIYDPIRDRMVVLAGSGTTPNGAWSLSLSGTPTWSDLMPWATPAVTAGFQSFYDPVRDRALLISVNAPTSDIPTAITSLDFKTDPNQPLWVQSFPGGAALGPRSGLVAAYKPDQDLIVAFGGMTSGSIDLDSSERLDLAGGFLLDAGAGPNGSVTMSKWCYGSGEIASVIAAPAAGYRLNQWIGDASGNANPLQVTMNGFKEIRAEFVVNPTAVEDLPVAFALDVHPNPSIGPARIEYALPREARVKLRVFDVAGREVARLVDGLEPAGRHVATWSGTAAHPNARSGIYLVRFETPDRTWTKRLAMLR